MSLKDDLIKRAKSGDTFAPKEQKDALEEQLGEEDIDLSEELDNELEQTDEDSDFGDIDLSSALDDMDSFSSFEEELDDPDPEPEPEPAPVSKKRGRKKKAPVYNEDEEERIAAEQYAASNRAEAVFEQEKPARKSNKNDLGVKLVDLAKGIVLRDMLEHFESEIVTTKALTKMVESYLETKNVSVIANGNAILSAVIDEVIDSCYEEDHYGGMTKDILLAVKSDL